MISKKRLRTIIEEEVTKSFSNAEIEEMFNLPERTVEELKMTYFDYSTYTGNCGFGNILMTKRDIGKTNDNTNYITEATEQPLPFQQVVNNLYQKYLINPWQFKEIQNITASNGINIICIIADINRNCDLVIDAMKQMGYFKSVKNDNVIVQYGMTFRVMQFEPLVQKTENDLIRSMKAVFHITPTYNAENIEKNGFIPQSKNSVFNYPDRVYFVKGNTYPYRILEIVQMLSDSNFDQRNDGSYTIFMVDLKKVPLEINFYLDPNMEESCFVEEKVPSMAIMRKMDIHVEH